MHFPALIQDLAVILGVAAIVTFVFRRIRQPVVLGYIIAGVIVGPYTPAIFTVSDTANIKIWAELGVIFLMFSLGLEFSFRRLSRVGFSAVTTGVFEISFMMIAGFVAARLLNMSAMDAVFLGCMVAISSTTIIIKAFEELRLSTHRFAELVFGILIVEDLAAILMLVALTNIATTTEIGGLELLMAGLKLVVVVSAWFVIGMFTVPRFVKSVVRHGNEEMLTVVAIALCLALVALAANFHYSVALGAFIMGSILAENPEVKRIEHLVRPLRDIFGAVFFVSVGMLLDPQVLLEEWSTVVAISLVIMLGKLVSVTSSALATGKNLRTSVQTGFSMAQVGEFSFIIAGLGLAYNAISPSLYPVIVAASVITTFTTPYLIRAAGPCATAIEKRLPAAISTFLERYANLLQRVGGPPKGQGTVAHSILKWALNAVVVVTVFTIGASQVIDFLAERLPNRSAAIGVTWALAFLLCAPSLWAMTNAFRDPAPNAQPTRQVVSGTKRIISVLATIAVLGLLSIEYFPALPTLIATLLTCSLFLAIFRRQISTYYRWIELNFRSGFGDTDGAQQRRIQRLAPWDAHLVEIPIPPRSSLIGKSLLQLALREKYGLNVVVISRVGADVVAPKATEILYPEDRLLCFATDQEIERFRKDLDREVESLPPHPDNEEYDLVRLQIKPQSIFDQTSIKDSGIREKFDCIVVGLERDGKRIPSPISSTVLRTDDIVWVVGERGRLRLISELF